MVSFNAAASALIVLASTSMSAAANTRANRRLSYETIAGYEPQSQVTDHVSILYSIMLRKHCNGNCRGFEFCAIISPLKCDIILCDIIWRLLSIVMGFDLI